MPQPKKLPLTYIFCQNDINWQSEHRHFFHTFGLSIASLAATALAIGISELGGEVLVTLFTDKIGKRRAVVIGLIAKLPGSIGIAFWGSMEGWSHAQFILVLSHL